MSASNDDGTLADTDLRTRLASHLMDARAHTLTINRITAEAKGKVNVSARRVHSEELGDARGANAFGTDARVMGAQGLGWEGNEFTKQELGTVREWLFGKAMSIYGGSFEVQNNIISKRILGLPETTQKG